MALETTLVAHGFPPAKAWPPASLIAQNVRLAAEIAVASTLL